MDVIRGLSLENVRKYFILAFAVCVCLMVSSPAKSDDGVPSFEDFRKYAALLHNAQTIGRINASQADRLMYAYISEYRQNKSGEGEVCAVSYEEFTRYNKLIRKIAGLGRITEEEGDQLLHEFLNEQEDAEAELGEEIKKDTMDESYLRRKMHEQIRESLDRELKEEEENQQRRRSEQYQKNKESEAGVEEEVREDSDRESRRKENE